MAVIVYKQNFKYFINVLGYFQQSMLYKNQGYTLTSVRLPSMKNKYAIVFELNLEVFKILSTVIFLIKSFYFIIEDVKQVKNEF